MATRASLITLVLAASFCGAAGVRKSISALEKEPIADADAISEEDAVAEPWQGKISEISSEQLRSVMQGDTNFMLNVQKDIALLLRMKRNLPEVIESKYRDIDDASEEFFSSAFSTALSGLKAVKSMATAIKAYKTYKTGKKVLKAGKMITRLQAARLELLISQGRAVPTEYAHDVPLGSLYHEYLKAQRAVNMKFYAKTQDWYKFKGVQPPPIYADLEHLDTRIASMRRQEEFIIDEVTSHLVPDAIASTFSSTAEKPVDFDATNPFSEAFDTQISDPKVYTTSVTKASVAKFGHLGDGRGWVRLDVPSRYGGIAETRTFSAAERQKRCELMQHGLNQLTLPDDSTIETLRDAASKTRAVTHHWGWGLGQTVVSVALVGTAFFCPPAAVGAGVVSTAAGISSKTLSVGSQAAFQAFMTPLLEYTFISLANLEFQLFNPDMKPQSGESVCSFDPNWLDQFKKDFKMPEKTTCDIVNNKCGENQFCMREGIFTRTTGRHLRSGFCMKAAWPLLENDMTCTGDSECSSGVCDFDAILLDSDFTPDDDDKLSIEDNDGNTTWIEHIVDLFKDKTVFAEMKKMMGRCVEPCDLTDPTCSRHEMNSAFGVRKYVVPDETDAEESDEDEE